ncbi:hypothetical protein BH09BAC1_BH09BAC1_19610 [soil metagenome]
MKKFLLVLMMGTMAHLLSAQCTPPSPATVFDTVIGSLGSNVVITGIPSGVVIRLEIPNGNALVKFDMCASASGTNNDSYITLLDANNSSANFVDFGDDGCTGLAGPTLDSFFISTAGTYFVYVTEYDLANFDACDIDATNTNFVMEITVTGSIGLANDDCDNAIPLTLGVPLNTNNNNATGDRATEGVGNVTDSTLAEIGIFAPSNFPNGVVIGKPFWYSFNAAVGGSYIIKFANYEYFNWGFDLAFYRASDISCSDILSSDLTRGIYRVMLTEGDTSITDTVTLAAGNYLIPVSEYYDQEGNFSITITKAVVDESCASAAAGSVTISPACITYGDNVNIDQLGPFHVPNVGNLPNYYTVIGTGPITDFANLANDPNYLYAFDDFPLGGGFTIPTVDPDFGTVNFPVGNYYYYFIASGNTRKENDRFSFDINCSAISAPAQFQVLAVGDSTCTVGVEELFLQSNLQLYPNPANNVLNVRLDNSIEGTYKIMGANGQLFLTGELMGAAQIDISMLSSGVYLFVAATDKQQVVKRFTVFK